MKAVLYSTGCPRCEVLKKKLDSEGVEYEVCTDIDEMQKLGFMSVPMLKVGEKVYNYDEAVNHLPEITFNSEGD